MPLPEDPKVVETSTGLVKVLKDIFGSHPGFRPAHAKGILLKGTFTATSTAASLSKAPHFNQPSTPVLARFSSSTGLPQLPDVDPNGNPRGFALRFQLATTPRRVHTDIISHSTPFFPSSNGENVLEFFTSVKDGTTAEFLSRNPKALAFVQAPKPTASSFSREKFFSVHAFKFVAADGKETFVRYRFYPVAGEDYLDEEALKTKSPNFLFDEIPTLLQNSGTIKFKLLAQIAKDGDVTDDATEHWPEDQRELVELGIVELNGLVEDDAEEQRKIIFDPMPRVEGVESSGDPLLDIRAGIYLISGRERRAAK